MLSVSLELQSMTSVLGFGTLHDVRWIHFLLISAVEFPMRISIIAFIIGQNVFEMCVWSSIKELITQAWYDSTPSSRRLVPVSCRKSIKCIWFANGRYSMTFGRCCICCVLGWLFCGKYQQSVNGPVWGDKICCWAVVYNKHESW